MLQMIFIISILCLFTTYSGYIVFLYAVRLFCKKPAAKKQYFPHVSIIINAHNEAQIIRDKIENTLSLDYPSDKLEIVVSSDGSDDKTVEISKEYEFRRVKVFDYKEHKGKVHAINQSVRKTSGEIIVFTDANAMLDRKAVMLLTKNFSDDKVGCVCGRLCYKNPETNQVGENFYKRYENYLRELESQTGSILSAEGSLFSIRKSLFHEIPEAFGEDVFLVYLTVQKNKRAIFEKEAVSVEDFCISEKDQIKRRARVVSRNLVMLLKNISLLNPFLFGIYSLKLLFHKVFRWLSPFFLIAVFFTNMYLLKNYPFYVAIFVLQVLFYVLACSHMIFFYLFHKKRPLFYIPYFFAASNMGMLLGFFYFFMNRSPIKWNIAR
ncbi:MAG: glycosyltransferase family 2 protein [Candidatus Aureabacteria bacterium]|nr:glycosyltransferase family 2 protein [Candidatus Auribacterota bacterium]